MITLPTNCRLNHFKMMLMCIITTVKLQFSWLSGGNHGTQCQLYFTVTHSDDTSDSCNMGNILNTPTHHTTTIQLQCI